VIFDPDIVTLTWRSPYWNWTSSPVALRVPEEPALLDFFVVLDEELLAVELLAAAVLVVADLAAVSLVASVELGAAA
jgi:hypothetical protein